MDIAEERCTRRHPGPGSCKACARACPADAIRLDTGTATIDPDLCPGCGACVAACPAGAIVDRLLTEPDILAWAGAPETRPASLTLTCAKNPAPPADARRGTVQPRRLPCLGRLTPGVLLGLLDAGVRAIVIHRPGCSSCVWAPAGRVLDDTLQQARALARAAGLEPGAIRLVETAPAASPATGESEAGGGTEAHGPGPGARENDRRLFLRESMAWAGRLAASAMASSVEKAASWLPAGPDPRSVLLEILRRRAGAAPGSRVPSKDLPFAQLEVLAGCDACGACERACAPRAIRVERADDRARVLFEPAACTACGRCESACRPGVLHHAADLDLAWLFAEPVRRLAEVRGRPCTICGALSQGPEEVCTLCHRSRRRGFENARRPVAGAIQAKGDPA